MLGSVARSEILRALAYQPEPVGLRYVARLGGVHPHSAERALAGLVREGLVTRTRRCARPVYAIDPENAEVGILKAAFDAAAAAQARVRAGNLAGRARTLLPFIEETVRLMSRARRSRRER